MGELNGSTEFKKVLKGRRMENYVLHLYVKDMSLKSVQAIENIKQVCEENLQGHYQLDVIDICERPILARESQIIATPTLIKESPLPLRRLVGNMSNTERVLIGLGL
ncbi:MAG TPA: circadian clock KaiB family protein [Methanotrichaceae archaeon]|nr:circadian clock KaiB family protein [Methanotrichaceae archaeon]